MKIRETLEALLSGAMLALFVGPKPVIADEIYMGPEDNARYADVQKKRKHNKQTVGEGIESDVISATFVDMVAGNEDGHTTADETSKFLELIENSSTFYHDELFLGLESFNDSILHSEIL